MIRLEPAERDPVGALCLPIENIPTVPSHILRIWGTATIHLEKGTELGTFVTAFIKRKPIFYMNML